MKQGLQIAALRPCQGLGQRQGGARGTLAGVLAVGCVLASLGCGGSDDFAPKQPQLQAKVNADGTIEDRSMCEWRGKADREASETAGPGAIQPNVRRVWQVNGTGIERQKILICREIDTNFDGIKDVVRRYNDKGESLKEEADSNYDGRIDTWITFATGRLAEVKLDNTGDGNPDEWKFYTEGKLTRIKRDSNGNGKPDIWEIYRKGKLERMGVDVDGDERVDRWDHDKTLRREREREERAAEEKLEAEKEKKDKEAADTGADDFETDGT